MAKFSFKPMAISQLYTCVLYAHWLLSTLDYTEMAYMPIMPTSCISKKLYCEGMQQ